MHNSLSIYLAGPITGQTGEEVISRYEEKIAILSDFGYVVYHPRLGKMNLRTETEFKSGGYDDHPIANDHAIFTRDHWMVSKADVILADLSNSGGRVSIGTVMELAWASHMGKHVVLVLPHGNVHDHAFVRQAATIRLGDIEEAYDYLKELSLARMGVQ
jgi:nucleoside 2-deoxyribosyltransferase